MPDRTSTYLQLEDVVVGRSEVREQSVDKFADELEPFAGELEQFVADYKLVGQVVADKPAAEVDKFAAADRLLVEDGSIVAEPDTSVADTLVVGMLQEQLRIQLVESSKLDASVWA